MHLTLATTWTYNFETTDMGQPFQHDLGASRYQENQTF